MCLIVNVIILILSISNKQERVTNINQMYKYVNQNITHKEKKICWLLHICDGCGLYHKASSFLKLNEKSAQDKQAMC